MKKTLLTLLTLGVLASVTLTANETITPGACNFNSDLTKELATAQKMTARYEKNATDAKAKGNEDLANAYQACSDAKGKMADSLNKYLSSVDKACKIANNNENLSSIVGTTLAYDKKGERLTTRIKKLQACRETNENNKELSAELNDMISGLKNYSTSKKEFKTANANLIALKKKA